MHVYYVFPKKKISGPEFFFFNSTPPISVHCFSPSQPARSFWRFFSRLAMRIEGQNRARLGFLECCSECVQAGTCRLIGLTFTERAMGRHVCGEMQNAPTRAPRRRLGVSEKYCSLSHPLLCKCPYSIRPASVHTMLLALCLLFTHDPVVLQLFLYLLLHTQRCYQSEG